MDLIFVLCQCPLHFQIFEKRILINIILYKHSLLMSSGSMDLIFLLFPQLAAQLLMEVRFFRRQNAFELRTLHPVKGGHPK